MRTHLEDFAREAWRYLEVERDARTGLVRSTPTFRGVTLWDIANQAWATDAASRLGLASEAEADRALDGIAAALERLPVDLPNGDGLPNRFHRVDTLEPTDSIDKPSPGGCGWSATDIGHLLRVGDALARTRQRWRRHWPSPVGRWNLTTVTHRGFLEGSGPDHLRFDETRYPYGTYAASGFETAGLSVAFRPPTHALSMFGETVHWDEYGLTTLEPFLLEALLPPRETLFHLADSLADLLRLQERRFHRTGIVTCASEGPLDMEPYYAYHCIVSGIPGAEGIPFVTIADGKPLATVPPPAPVSTRGIVVADVLHPTPYWDTLAETVRTCLATGAGFLSGFYAAGGAPILRRDLNTNALILVALGRAQAGSDTLDRSGSERGVE
ncbi:MAG: DUF3131 domain-containing protein [Thermoplasmata archaeon]